MKVLISALACSSQVGSEALVGYHVVQAVSQRYEAEVITSTVMQPPEVVKTHCVGVRCEDPNDVAPAQLLRFEFCQRRVVSRLLRAQEFDLVHRVTPSGYKDSLLPVPAVPLVLGPLLGSDPPPASFRSIFQPRLPRSYSLRPIGARIRHGVAHRVFRRFSTFNQLLESAALILVGTEVTRRRLPERLHSRCRRVTYAGVEHDQFTPPVGGRTSRTPQLLFVGRLVPYKGIELLLRAVAVARRCCRFELKIVGSGDARYRTYFLRLAADLQLTGAVTFVDHQPREALIRIYRMADVFCMPSIETYGLAILESMSSGCAPLVADLNGPGEIVQPGTGLKVPLETPEQFIATYAERIVELVEDAQLRVALGEAARDHVVRVHDWQRIESAILEIYDETFSKTCTAEESAPCCSGPGLI